MNQSDIPILDWFGCYKTGWGDRLVPEAYSHPAKGAYGLAERIYKHALERGYLQRGSTIVDPFGGICGFGFHAMLNGMNFTAVELEPRFVALGNENIALWNTRYGPHLPGWGTACLLQGDSRQLAQVLAKAGVAGIVSSPPFSPLGNNPTGQGQGVRADYREGKRTAATPKTEYGTTAGQLGAMPMADVAAVISSPPFVGVEPTRDDAFRYTDGRPLGSTGDHYGTADGQLGVMDEGDVHGIVSSPPYSERHDYKDPEKSRRHVEKLKEQGGQIGGVNIHQTPSDNPNNLANMPSGIVSSPPYEGSAAGNQGANQRRAQDRDVPFADLPGDRYGDSEGQLGGEVAETFWAAARQIVQQCYQVLAPGGYAIWVCKDFVRNKQRVPFSDQWLALCQHVGFLQVEWIRAWVIEEAEAGQADIFGQVHTKRTERKSFFRRLAEKKGSPRIDWEDVLIVRKPL